MVKDADALVPTIEYEVAYRNVKYPRIEYKTGSLLLILPKEYTDEAMLLEKHKRWITGKEQIIKQALDEAKEKVLNMRRTEEELRQLASSTVAAYQRQYDFRINKLHYRKMKTKWGSYSPKRNLTINTLLQYLPRELIRYVIFHELVHSKERRHNEEFWRIISREFPDHEKFERALLVYWFLIQKEG